MTKADFMRDVKSGLKLRLIGGFNYEWIKKRRPQHLKSRRISKIQSNAIYLEGEENGGQGSYLEIPPASLMEYDGKILSIYLPGIREMTQEEKDNIQKAKNEQEKFKKEHPYNDDFWHMKEFYKNCSTPWIYFGNGKIKGKRAGQGSDYGKIIDNAIKGKLELRYIVEKG